MWVPAGNEVVLKTAWPPLTGTSTAAPPSTLNATSPVMASGAADVTVAVNVTSCPNVDDGTSDTSTVVVDAWVTVWPTVPVLAKKSPLPR